MHDHGSIGLFLGNGLWEFGFECFCLFLFCFCLVWGEKVASAQDFGWQSKGEGHFRSWFPFFSCLLGDNFVLFRYCLVQRPFCIFLLFSSDLWSGTIFLFLLSPTLWLRIFFLFCFLPFFDWEFSFFVFFRGQGLTFSPRVKVYDKLGFRLKACRTAGHDICQGLASGLGIKGMSHIISMIHMQQWWLGNFMHNWSHIISMILKHHIFMVMWY